MSLKTVEVARQLVRIPSHETEAPLLDYVQDVVAENLPGFATRRIDATFGAQRESLIIANHPYPDIILIAHGDTKPAWPRVSEGRDGDGIYDPYAADIIDGKVYGRGIGDNKAGVATIITACEAIARATGVKPRVMGIITGDEEGGLTGIQTVAENVLAPMRLEAPKYTPWVLSLNGSKGELGHGCRGCIEIDVAVHGKTGHSAIRLPGDPIPVSALIGTALLANDISEFLGSLPKSELMGLTTVNLAGGTAGVWQDDGSIKVEANQVPDAFMGKFEFRPTDGTIEDEYINSQSLTKLIHRLAAQRELTIARAVTALDVDAWIPDPSGLDWFEEIIKANTGMVKVPEWPIAQHGYDEAGMAVQALNRGRKPGELRVTGAIFGMADGRFHAPDEYVTVSNIQAQHEIVLATLQHPRFNPRRNFKV